MDNAVINKNEILYKSSKELVRIRPWGNGAIRFQSFPGGEIIEKDYTLLPQDSECTIDEGGNSVTMHNGGLSLTLHRNGRIEAHSNGHRIISEKPELTFEDGYRRYDSIGKGIWRAKITLEANEGEHFFGLGHSWDNPYDLKGASIDIRNINAKCSIPYIYSSLGYGIVWNMPCTGMMELSANHTRYSSDCCESIDMIIIAGTPKEACSTLADLYGHAPVMPEWATGFWQSRLRYETQEDLLRVARRYRDEDIPLSAIVCDYFHWTEQGDYRFDPQYWPDIQAMTDELHDMGTKLVVSVWPTMSESSENYRYAVDHHLLMEKASGGDRVFNFYGPQAEIDATNPQTRRFVWEKLKDGYIDKGVDALWFDEAEPEIHPEHFDDLMMHAGRGDMVGLLYPYYYSQMAYDGFRSMGRDDIVTLTRCAYLGSQKFGSLVWSGDIRSSFDSLEHQVKGGMNMAMCGIPWWNTDIGGFYGGDTTSDEFRELIVRWFQFGVFSPVMRLHGNRNRHGESSGLKEASGDPNEIWSFGERNYPILRDLIMLRERLRPYIHRQMVTAAQKGYPVIRPMFFEYPQDEVCYTTDSQYMFGDDIIFAPIVKQGQTEKDVYIPDGEWILTTTGEIYGAGRHIISADITEFIALVRKGAEVIKAFEK